MERNNLKHISTGEHTYWQSDTNKLPYLVDFCVTKSIPQDLAVAKSCSDLSSYTNITCAEPRKQPSLSNRHTNWDDFRHLINERWTLNVSFKTEECTETVVKFSNDTVLQWAGWNATPEHTDTLKTYNCPILNKQKLKKKDSVEAGTDYKYQREQNIA
jgi:hypothetical protein